MRKKLLLDAYERYALIAPSLGAGGTCTLWRNISAHDYEHSEGLDLKRFCPYGSVGEVVPGYIKSYPDLPPVRIRIDKIEVVTRTGMDCHAYRLIVTYLGGNL